MRASTAYFVGAGSIVAAIAIGLGGGIVAGNIMHPIAPKQGPDTGKMAQRAEPAASPTTTTSAPSERVQYLTGSQTFGGVIAAPAQAQDEAKPEAKPDVQTTQASAEPPAPPPPQTTAAVEPPKPTPASPPQVTKPVEPQASTEPASPPDNAYAKARDSDVKRAASERRRVERRERWAERRRYDPRDASGARDQTNWDDVARNVRQDSDVRDVARRPRSGFMLFGTDD
ncbi:hypothetical protein UB31_03365 [Bradyrhizobium sp. LTSP849]|jgi:hypothetical protein|uniref:hypothetical protein n=1 Tax=Bradyrhizobium sp. LTSP849 TaxID=1615890 RepID=UPI0005D16BD2|nr:hypothetical protein [Bradyrhizobium sp. LTSP849]KJC54679.1 hypothetical protein UB31_03365 [Bradyrhizobium sp. LTSP849]